jgi:hypothetical protein
VSTTKIVSLTASAQVAPPAASAWPTFSKVRRVCASQSPAGAIVPSAAMGTWPEVHTSRPLAGRLTTWL